MTNYEFFKTKKYNISEVESKMQIYSDDLILLLKDEDLRQLVTNKYSLTQSIIIDIDKIDVLYYEIKKFVERFKLLRLNVQENNVVTYLKDNPETNFVDYYFLIKEACDEYGVIFENIHAVAIYDSLNLFYQGRSLTQYVKSINSNSKIDKKMLLEDLNASWEKYYKTYPEDVKNRNFRILKNNDLYYVKSINTDFYKEYGIAESFVLSMLELHKIQSQNKGIRFKVSSLDLRESKIDLIISLDKKVIVKDIGFFKPSISIRNEDQGNTSLGVYNSIVFFPEKDKDTKVYLFPRNDKDLIENRKTARHTINKDTLLDLFESISSLFTQLDDIEKDFKFYKGARTPDELRQKIEERVCSPNSMFKGLFQLKDLFSKDKSGQIDNLETLLRICGKAEMLDMEFDLKFKLGV